MRNHTHHYESRCSIVAGVCLRAGSVDAKRMQGDSIAPTLALSSYEFGFPGALQTIDPNTPGGGGAGS